MGRQTDPRLIEDKVSGTFYVMPTGPKKGQGKRNGSTNRLLRLVNYLGIQYFVRTINVTSENFKLAADEFNLELSDGMIIVPTHISPDLVGSRVGTILSRKFH